jgi:hypothetical protein
MRDLYRLRTDQAVGISLKEVKVRGRCVEVKSRGKRLCRPVAVKSSLQ